MPSVCEQCGLSFPVGRPKELIGEYDEIEIRRSSRMSSATVASPADARVAGSRRKLRPLVATTTPFGPRIHALAIYLKGFQALSYERLRALFRDAFGLECERRRADEHVHPLASPFYI